MGGGRTPVPGAELVQGALGPPRGLLGFCGGASGGGVTGPTGCSAGRLPGGAGAAQVGQGCPGRWEPLGPVGATRAGEAAHEGWGAPRGQWMPRGSVDAKGVSGRPAGLGRPRRAARSTPRHGYPPFESVRGYGSSPQIRRFCPVHSLGTGKLSRFFPQARLLRDHQGSSAGCGSVDKLSPQAVEKSKAHKPPAELSTGRPQAGASCPQRMPTSPHPCPLFGNPEAPLTASSERRHTTPSDWPVGNMGKPGDASGGNSAQPVNGMCRTLCSPQRPRVVHRSGPQGRWTKYRR
jgi:hypothetical protein